MKKSRLSATCLSAACCCLLMLSVSQVRADAIGSTTYYTIPSHLTRMLISQGGLYEPSASVTNVAMNDSVFRRDDCRSCDIGPVDCGKKSFWKRIELYGWVEGGFYVNAHGNTSDHATLQDRQGRAKKFQTAGSGNSSVLGNVRSTEGMVNQLWLGMKRELDTRHGLDWGFQVDFLYGTDGWLAQSYGDASFDYKGHHRDYYSALPQLHASVGYKDWSVKVGKFETLLGFERLQAPQSFFYSHSNLFYAEPQTHSGVQFEYKFRKNLWFSFGYVQGENNSFRNRFDDHGFLGGVYWRPLPAVTVWYTLYAVDHGGGVYDNGQRHPGGNVYRHTLVTNWKITGRWDYTFQWDLGTRDGRDGDRGATYYGTAHYLTYKINPKWTAGLRFDQMYSRRPLYRSGFARPGMGNFEGDLYSLTLGFNWTPHHRLNIRPELRFDHAKDSWCFDGGRKRDQFSAGCGAIYRF